MTLESPKSLFLSGPIKTLVTYSIQLSKTGMSCIRRALQSASLCNGTLPKSALWRFVTDSLSETECCIATRQNKMAAPGVVSVRFKKCNVLLLLLLFLDEVHCA